MKTDLARHYYLVKPFLSRRLQLLIRSLVAARKRARFSDTWPIDERAGEKPEGWRQWPDQKRFTLVLTHDVDTFAGHEQCRELMELEMSHGFRSSFNFVAASYPVSQRLRTALAGNGFEVGVHGLRHDRSLYDSRENFRIHAAQINRYLEEWGAVGFRSPCMYHNLDWLGELAISYDSSTFDTDPFEPQPDGVGTIFPFFVKRSGGLQDYVELPYTLPQDFTLFIMLKEKSIQVWKNKLRWIAQRGGMALLNTHPDYMCFSGEPRFDQYQVQRYEEFLLHVKQEYGESCWYALPCEVARFMEYQRRTGEPLAERPPAMPPAADLSSFATA